MLKRTFALMLSGILVFVAFGLQSVRAQTAGDAQRAEQTRIKIQRIGLGRDARIEVKLLDGRRLKGYVSGANQDSFTVTDSKTGASESIAYDDVREVKKSRRGLSPLTWAIIAGAAVATIIVAVTVIRPVVCDGGAGC